MHHESRSRGLKTEVWSLKRKAEGLFICGSAAGNGGMGMVRHSHGACGLRSKVKGQRSKVDGASWGRSLKLKVWSLERGAEGPLYAAPPREMAE